MMATCHSNTLESSTRPAEKPSTGVFFKSGTGTGIMARMGLLLSHDTKREDDQAARRRRNWQADENDAGALTTAL